MPGPLRQRARLAAAAVLLALPAAAVVTVPAQAKSYDDELHDVRVATARFHSVQQARKAGYHPTPECVSSPAGTMGVHFENPTLMADPGIDPLRPEILLYAPGPGGKLKLVGVEYWQAAAAANTTPSLFGRAFNGPMPGHHPGMATHYDLHVWVWADNPAGTFSLFNPTLSC